MGRMSNMIKDLLEEDVSDVSFEPDEELLEAIDNKKNSNVISIVKKKFH
jgi:predicted rRNA methylase YqxC with S4 and FtsJ domains